MRAGSMRRKAISPRNSEQGGDMDWKTSGRAPRAAAVVLLAIAAAMLSSASRAAEQPYLFNVVSQRSIALTAQYWNPILSYVSRKSGVPLELRMAKTVKEGDAAAEKGVYQFLYTNHFFTPERDRIGFQVIARPAGPAIRGQIVVAHDSPIKSLQDLNGKEVAFPSPDAFAAYWLPMDALLKAKVSIKPVFTGNQEAAAAQLRLNKVTAAGFNDLVVERYGQRENWEYRVLWESGIYNDLCIMAHPKVPKVKIAAVRTAFVSMHDDPEGRKVLEDTAAVLKITGELGFVAGENRDYDNYRAFFKNTLVKDSK
jgi:phosphonate transport system substrate-binding protein